MESEQEDTTTEADESTEAPEFNPEDIENDPAYNPDDSEHLKDLKGG